MQLFTFDILRGSLITDTAAVSLSLSLSLSLYFAFVHFWHFAARFINHRSCRCGLMWHWKRPRVASYSQTVFHSFSMFFKKHKRKHWKKPRVAFHLCQTVPREDIFSVTNAMKHFTRWKSEEAQAHCFGTWSCHCTGQCWYVDIINIWKSHIFFITTLTRGTSFIW